MVDAGPVSLIMFDSSFTNTGQSNPTTESSFTNIEAVTSTNYIPDLATQVASLHGKPAFFVTTGPPTGSSISKNRAT